MEMMEGDKLSLTSEVSESAAASSLELAEGAPSLVEADSQHRAGNHILRAIGGLSINERFSEIITVGQVRARKLTDGARRLPGAIKSGAVALQNFGQSVANTTSKAVAKAAEQARNAPGTAATFVVIGTWALLEALEGGSWDERRDRIENYFTTPERPYYPPAPRPVHRPAQAAATYTRQADKWPPEWVDEFRATLRTRSEPQPLAAPTQSAAQAAASQQPVQPSQPTTALAPPAPPLPRPTAQRTTRPARAQAYLEATEPKHSSPWPTLATAFESQPGTDKSFRLVSVYDGGHATHYFHGPAQSTYKAVRNWLRDHPGSYVLADTPFTPLGPDGLQLLPTHKTSSAP